MFQTGWFNHQLDNFHLLVPLSNFEATAESSTGRLVGWPWGFPCDLDTYSGWWFQIPPGSLTACP